MDDAKAQGRFRVLEAGCCLTALAVQLALRRLYNSAGHAQWAGLLGAANGSVWEQMKTLYFSLLLCSAPEFLFAGRGFFRVFTAKVSALSVLALSFAAFYYTYTGALGFHDTAVDTLGGLVLTVVACVFCYRVMVSEKPGVVAVVAGMVVFVSLFAAFAAFTERPPRQNLFRDPKSGLYGLPQSTENAFAGADFACLPKPAPPHKNTAPWETTTAKGDETAKTRA